MLDKDRLKGKIKEAFTNEQTKESDPNASIERLSEAIATAVIDEIKQATIVYTSGLVASIPSGVVAGEFKHTIS